MALDPSTFLSTPAASANPTQIAGAQQLSQMATPMQIQSMYDYAKALRDSSNTPVKSWTQGVSNIVKALMGNSEQNNAANSERSLYASRTISDADHPGDLPGFGTIDSNRPVVSGGNQAGLSTDGYQPSDPGLAASESGGNDANVNPVSHATGRYQFVDGTWKDIMQRHPDLGLTPDGRMDPAQQEKAKAAYDQDNAKVLQTAGYEPNQTNERLAMRFGAGGATKVLGADPSAPMSSVMSQNVLAMNPDLRNATAGGTIQRYASLGAPQLPPDAQATVRALNPNTQIAQNGPMPQQGMGNPQDTIRELANHWIMTGMSPQQALATATQYVQNNMQLMPQYTTDPYGREMMVQPGRPPQFTGRQMGPGQVGQWHGFDVTKTVGPDGGLQEKIVVPGASSAPAASAPGPQGAAQTPGNVGAASPAAGAPQSASVPSSVNLAGPAPQGTQIAEPPAPAPAPKPPTAGITNPPENADPAAMLQWETNLDAAQKGAVKGAESMAEAAAKGKIKPVDDAVEEGTKAGPILNDLDTLRDAYANAGDNLNGGPFADTILKAKQGINEMLPGTSLVDQDKLNAAQIVQKVNMGLATKMVKELTSRGTQMEILLAMKNNPGIMMSDKASLYMIDLLKQIQQQKQELGELASKKGYDNPGEWNTM